MSAKANPDVVKFSKTTTAPTTSQLVDAIITQLSSVVLTTLREEHLPDAVAWKRHGISATLEVAAFGGVDNVTDAVGWGGHARRWAERDATYFRRVRRRRRELNLRRRTWSRR